KTVFDISPAAGNVLTRGCRALAAWSAVWISVIPRVWRLPAVVVIMAHITSWDNAIPIITSDLMNEISFLEIIGELLTLLLISLILCLATSSSASSEACQKKAYGVKVAPNIATNTIAKAGVNSKCGIIVVNNKFLTSSPTIIAVAT